MIEKVKSAMVGLGAGWVLILMLVLSVVSLAIMLERAWLYWSLRDDANALMRDLGRFLRAGDLDGARKRLETSPSAEAAVVVAGIVEARMGAEAAEEAMAGASALQRLKLEKRITFLGTLGNNAPFIGLLGTVIGIVGAFDELGKAKNATLTGAAQVAPEAVMANIAEALVATAVGLLVAIPAVAAFNTFQRIVRTTLGNTEALSHVLLAHLKATGEGGAAVEDAMQTAAAHAERPEQDSKQGGAFEGRGVSPMAGGTTEGDEAITGINVTPLVDIVLVLLIIFMVTAKLIVNKSIPLDLPKAATGSDIQTIFSVVLASDGSTQVDSKLVANDDQILGLAKKAHETNPDLRAVIKADMSVPHGRVIHVLDLLKQAQVAKIAFGVQPTAPGAPGAVPPPAPAPK